MNWVNQMLGGLNAMPQGLVDLANQYNAQSNLQQNYANRIVSVQGAGARREMTHEDLGLAPPYLFWLGADHG